MADYNLKPSALQDTCPGYANAVNLFDSIGNKETGIEKLLVFLNLEIMVQIKIDLDHTIVCLSAFVDDVPSRVSKLSEKYYRKAKLMHFI